MVGLGRSVSRVEMNAKYSALDTALPKQTLPYALFTAKGPKKSLDKADAVIHGATLRAGATLRKLLHPVDTVPAALDYFFLPSSSSASLLAP